MFICDYYLVVMMYDPYGMMLVCLVYAMIICIPVRVGQLCYSPLTVDCCCYFSGNSDEGVLA